MVPLRVKFCYKPIQMSIHSIRFGAEVKSYFPIIAKIMSLSGAEKLIPQPNMALLFMAE